MMFSRISQRPLNGCTLFLVFFLTLSFQSSRSHLVFPLLSFISIFMVSLLFIFNHPSSRFWPLSLSFFLSLSPSCWQGRISVERVVSGKGLVNIYKFLRSKYSEQVIRKYDERIMASTEGGKVMAVQRQQGEKWSSECEEEEE